MKYHESLNLSCKCMKSTRIPMNPYPSIHLQHQIETCILSKLCRLADKCCLSYTYPLWTVLCYNVAHACLVASFQTNVHQIELTLGICPHNQEDNPILSGHSCVINMISVELVYKVLPLLHRNGNRWSLLTSGLYIEVKIH